MKKEYREITIIEVARIFSDALAKHTHPILAYKDGADWVTGELIGIDSTSKFPFNFLGKPRTVRCNRCAVILYPELISESVEIKTLYIRNDGDRLYLYHDTHMIASLHPRDDAEEMLDVLSINGIIELKEI